MERRDFIVRSGTMLPAATFLTMFGNSNNLFGADHNSAKRPNPDGFSQPILKAIAIGINAPSPHNTQSWKFKVLDDTAMYRYVNESILLPATDPPVRQIHLDAGCFIETLVIGASSLGFKSRVSYFPDGYESSNDFGIKPVAKIELSTVAGESDSLSGYINARQTNKRGYEGPVISNPEFQTLKEWSGNSQARMVFINENLEPYFDIFIKGLRLNRGHSGPMKRPGNCSVFPKNNGLNKGME